MRKINFSIQLISMNGKRLERTGPVEASARKLGSGVRHCLGLFLLLATFAYANGGGGTPTTSVVEGPLEMKAAAARRYVTPGLRRRPVPSPEIYRPGRKIYVAAVRSAGNGSLRSPLSSIQAALDLAQPGDTVRVMPGTYLMTTRTATVRDGTADRRISLVAHNPRRRPVLKRSGDYGGEILLIKHQYFLVDGFVMDGLFTSENYHHSYPNGEDSYRNIVSIPHYGGFFKTEPSREFYRHHYNGDHAIVRNCEIMRNRVDGLYIAADDVLIENCEVHHCLRGTFNNPTDAHCVIATHVANLTLRNCDLHHCSGDCIQVDPDIHNYAQTKLWDNVLAENCRVWTGPLAVNSADFLAGQNPGENGIDTKTFEDEPLTHRPRMTVKNIEVYGWVNNGYISNRSVFNIKYNVDWVMDGVRAHGNMIAFRLRGDWENTVQGCATLILKNALVYDNDKSFLAERLIRNLHIYNCTFVNNPVMFDHRLGGPYSVGYDPATYEMKNCLFLGAKPADAADASNLSGAASWFKNVARKKFWLKRFCPAVNTGVIIDEVKSDIIGTPRPKGPAYDVGAYEQ